MDGSKHPQEPIRFQASCGPFESFIRQAGWGCLIPTRCWPVAARRKSHADHELSVMLFLIFFPTDALAADELISSTASLTASPPPKRRDAVIVGSTTLAALLVVGITSLALIAAFPHHTQGWANFLGSVAGLLAAIQYVPQIWYTYRLGDIKSLSIITMLIQVPGSFLFAFSLWQRVSWAGWSTWLVYIITGLLQAILLSMGISYWMAHRKHPDGVYLQSEDEDEHYGAIDDVDGMAGGGAEADERTGLLSGNGHGQSGTVKSRPIPHNNSRHGTATSNRQLSMLYAATPPDQDSDRSSVGKGR
jgi:uncharacterized protein with PQ loop repeat